MINNIFSYTRHFYPFNSRKESRSVLSNTVATSDMWLFKFKSIKQIKTEYKKISVPQSLQPHFKRLIAHLSVQNISMILESFMDSAAINNSQRRVNAYPWDSGASARTLSGRNFFKDSHFLLKAQVNFSFYNIKHTHLL